MPAGTSPWWLLLPRLQGFRNGWTHASPSRRLAYAFFLLLGAAFWAGLFAGSLYLLRAFFEVEVFGPILLRKLVEILFLGLFTFLAFSNVVTALSTFFLSEDLEFLLALPLDRASFHYARLAETFLQSSWMLGMFGLPVLLAYGIVHGAGPGYYLLLLPLLAAFALVPTALGVVVAALLVNLFPARRTRDFMALVGLLLVAGLLVLLRLLRPERLVDANAFQSLAAYLAALQAPVPALLPPRWASDALVAAAEGRPFPWDALGLLLLGAGAAAGAGRWLTQLLYPRGWAHAQESGPARGARARWLDALAWLARRLPHPLGPLVEKDVRVFFRDPAQWSQVVLLVALVGLYLFSVRAFPLDTLSGPWIGYWRTLFAFLNLGMTGFVMAGVAVRFQFAAVSGEGRAFWVARSAPLRAVPFLLAKALPGLLPMLALGELLSVTSCLLLGADLPFVLLAGVAGFFLALGISGLAAGMGAAFPDFKADNAARAAASPGGVLFMVLALLLVAAVLGLLAWPVYLWMQATYGGEAPSTPALLAAGAALLAALALCLAAAWLPLRRGARLLWERGL